MRISAIIYIKIKVFKTRAFFGYLLHQNECLQILVGTLLHMVFSSCFRLLMELTRTFTNSLSIQAQTDLIGFKSGDRAGQSIKFNSFSYIKPLTVWAMCARAISC